MVALWLLKASLSWAQVKVRGRGNPLIGGSLVLAETADLSDVQVLRTVWLQEHDIIDKPVANSCS